MRISAFCSLRGIEPTDCVEGRKGTAIRHCSIFQNSTDLSAKVNMAVKWQISTSKRFPFFVIKLMFRCCQKCWKIWRIKCQTLLGIFIMKSWKGLTRKGSIALMLADPQTEYTLHDLNVWKHCLASSAQWREFHFCGQVNFCKTHVWKGSGFFVYREQTPTTFSRKSNALPVFSGWYLIEQSKSSAEKYRLKFSIM